MRHSTTGLIVLALICLVGAPVLAGGASGKVSDGKVSFVIKDAVALFNPATGRLQVMLYDRPIDAEIKKELDSWDGESQLGMETVAVLALKKTPPKTGMPALDKDLQFVHVWVKPGSSANPWGDIAKPCFKGFSTKGGKTVHFSFKYDYEIENVLHMKWNLKVNAPIQAFGDSP